MSSKMKFPLAGVSRKKRNKNIGLIANMLPVTFYQTKKKMIKTGHEILANPDWIKLHSIVDKKDLDKKVVLEQEYQRPVNHARRMKRYFQRGGVKLVQEYIDDVVEFAKPIDLPFLESY